MSVCQRSMCQHLFHFLIKAKTNINLKLKSLFVLNLLLEFSHALYSNRNWRQKHVQPRSTRSVQYMLRAFGHHIAACCDMLGVVGLNLTIFKLEPTPTNTPQQGGQTRATCCTQQCCIEMLQSFGRGFTTDKRERNV